jgi:hypothetical protein
VVSEPDAGVASPWAVGADHGGDLVQSELAVESRSSGVERDSAEPAGGDLGSAADVEVSLEESGLKQMMAEEESEHSVAEVPAVEVLELEVEQQVGQGDWVDFADDFQNCTVGL